MIEQKWWCPKCEEYRNLTEKALESKEDKYCSFCLSKLIYKGQEREERKCVYSFAELVDKLSILLLKEVKIPKHKELFRKQKMDILHDIDLLIKDKNIKVNADLIHAFIVLAQINAHIWYMEYQARKGKDQDLEKLRLTHTINGIRNTCKNIILSEIGEKDQSDYKVDCLASDYELKDWEILWRKK